LWRTVRHFTERGRHQGIGVDADSRQLEEPAADSHATPAGEGASRGAAEAETAREKPPTSAATSAKRRSILIT